MKFRLTGLDSGLRGIPSLAGDKSIAHRAVILSSISSGKTILKNFPFNDDCLETAGVFKKLGLKILLNKASSRVIVSGKGLFNLHKPAGAIFVKESGTTFRLLLGVLATQDFKTWLNAGSSLSRRPMSRVIKPLRLMGAKISSTIHHPLSSIQPEEYPPIIIKGGNLKGITYKIPVASAQVKSAILLAGLAANGKTRIIEPVKTRDHTERMLKLFKAGIELKGNTVVVKGGRGLVSPGTINIPADISSAAFFMVAASIIPHSKILLKNVGLNPGRVGIVNALKKMGADLRIKRAKLNSQGNEPSGDILVTSRSLSGIRIKRNEIPSLIDELPILMVAGCFAKGVSIIENAGELRVKETDRIKSMVTNLTKMGADIKVVKQAKQENIIIKGVEGLRGTKLSSFGDHRSAMSMVIAGLAARGNTTIDDISCINKSFPNFLATLNKLK